MQFSPDKTDGKIDFSSLGKILIIRLGKIGDIVTTSFVFEIFKDNIPKSEIYLLTYKINKDVLAFNPRLKKVFYSKSNVTLIWNLLKLRFLKFDLLIDFNDNQSTTSSLIFRFLKANYKAAYDFKKYENIINIKISPLKKNESHIIERMRNFLIQIGISPEEKNVKAFFYLDPSIYSKIKKEMRGNAKLVTINLSAGAKIRYWEKEKWIELVKLIWAEYPTFRLLLLSTAEDELLRQEIHSSLAGSYCPASKILTIQHFAAYIKLSDVLITPDTSAVHIASAFGIPTIAFYPNYDWNFVSWQPYKIPHRSIKSNGESIKQIPVEEVFNAFQGLLNEINLQTMF